MKGLFFLAYKSHIYELEQFEKLGRKQPKILPLDYINIHTLTFYLSHYFYNVKILYHIL